MTKVSIKNLVSLVMEQINTQSRINAMFPPDKYVLIDDPRKYPELNIPVQQDGAERPTIQMQPEPNMDGVRKLQPEPELAMVAEAQENEYPIVETLETPMRIPSNELVLGAKTPVMPRIVCLDPETNEQVEGMVIGTEIRETPTGKRLLAFYNLEATTKVDRPSKKLWYVVLPELEHDKYYRRLFTDKPRGVHWQGEPVKKDVLQGLEMQLAVQGDDMSDEERTALIKKIATLRNASAKRFGIYPSVNEMFEDDQSLLDHLDICLIPETWATSKRTEHTTNVVNLKKFGGGTPEIDADFISTKDFTSVDEGINDVTDLRMSLAMGDGREEDREISQHVPRQHSNYIYHGGKWDSAQRVGDERAFERAGGKTPVYKLKSKNIQEGEKTVNIRSVLEIKGNVQGAEGGEYTLTAKFSSVINARNDETGRGENIGQLFEPIIVSDTKPLPEYNDKGKRITPDQFSLDTCTTFFVNQGRTTSQSKKTGFLPSLLARLGGEIKENVDPDQVLNTMLQLVQAQIDQEPEI